MNQSSYAEVNKKCISTIFSEPNTFSFFVPRMNRIKTNESIFTGYWKSFAVNCNGELISDGSTEESIKPKHSCVKIIKRTLQIKNVTFDLSFEDNQFMISHPKWSLMGSGATFALAYLDLLENSKIFLEGYLNSPITDLTFDAIEFRDFLLSFF